MNTLPLPAVGPHVQELISDGAASVPDERSDLIPCQQTRALLNRVLVRTELRLLAGDVAIRVDHLIDAPFIVPAPKQLVMTPEALASPHAAVILRHGLELARLRGIAPDAPSLCGLLAARAALRYLDPGLAPDPLLARVRALAGELPDRQLLSHCWAVLSVLQPSTVPALDVALLDRLAVAWPLALPAEELMTTGGDERLTPDPVSGLNKYGCATRPSNVAASFSSCTASTISERGYVAAEVCRQRLLQAALSDCAAPGLARAAEDIRTGILEHYGIGDVADAILTASGTDASLLATLLVQARAPGAALTSILMSPTETGSGVPNAVAGRHFARSTVFRPQALHASPLEGLHAELAVSTVALRSASMWRSPDDVNAAIVERIGAAFDQHHRAALNMMHASKTGMQAPSFDYLMHLKGRFGDRLDVIVDACQARISPTTLRAYLEAGCMVLLTGSKFYGGPAFSGVILLPHGCLDETLDHLPAGIRDYTSRHDWPIAPSCAHPDLNAGLLLRWSAALAEMRAFAATSERQAAILQEFGRRMHTHLHSRQPMIVPDTAFMPQQDHADWDAHPTIFSFGLRAPDMAGGRMDVAELAQLHKWLYSDISHAVPGRIAARPCLIGQPVQVDLLHGRTVGVLRMAAGARLVSDSMAHACLDGAYFDALDADINDVFEKISLILRERRPLRDSLAMGIRLRS